MPTLYASSTTIQLSVADLAKTTTTDPKPLLSSNVEDVARISAEFARGSRYGTLTEIPLYTNETHSHMRFLGTNQDMPFFMVQAGKTFFDRSSDKTHTRTPERVPLPETQTKIADVSLSLPDFHCNSDIGNENPDYTKVIQEYRRHQYPPVFVPHALCLTVFLSTASFLQSYDQKLKKTVYHDIKIDVYFNGELCGSSFIPERHRGKTYHMTEHIVRFSGRRIGRLLEKPWIIVPTGQNPDGSLSENRRILKGSYSGANARWEAISKTLGAEADRIGQDKHGEFPILADYLSTLAKLHMPREVEEMQKAGYPKYGLIDVVVITGKGQKDGASSPALTEPTSLRIKETKSSVQTNSGVTALKATSNLVVDFTANESTKTKGYEFLIPLNPEHHIEKSERLTCSPTIPTSQFHPSSLRRIASRAHPPSEQHAFETPGSAFCSLGNDPQKGSGDSFSFMPKPRLPMAMPYNFGFDSKRTLEEEIALLEAGAQQAANSENDESHVPNPIQRMTRSGLVNRDATSKQISAKLVGIGPERTKVIKLRMNFPTAEQTKRGLMQANPVTRPGPFNVSRGPTTLAAVPCSSPSTIPLLTEGFSEAFPTPDSRARMLPTMWTMPPLSEDSMLTYAPAGVVRPCKGERNGWFEEKRVLMGARFLVG